MSNGSPASGVQLVPTGLELGPVTPHHQGALYHAAIFADNGRSGFVAKPPHLASTVRALFRAPQ